MCSLYSKKRGHVFLGGLILYSGKAGGKNKRKSWFFVVSRINHRYDTNKNARHHPRPTYICNARHRLKMNQNRKRRKQARRARVSEPVSVWQQYTVVYGSPFVPIHPEVDKKKKSLPNHPQESSRAVAEELKSTCIIKSSQNNILEAGGWYESFPRQRDREEKNVQPKKKKKRCLLCGSIYLLVFYYLLLIIP